MTTNWATKQLTGWGRYPVNRQKCARPERRSEAVEALEDRDGDAVLPFGLGRSYGDAALIEDGRAILTRRLDRMLDFDPETGWLRVEAGVSLQEIIETFLPRGWFPPVVPGTQFVTAGGAVGCDIHGKNHHVHGSWGDHVRNLELLCASGDVVTCGPDQREELFWATVGGMGMTGMILAMDVKLMPVGSAAIDEESIRFDNLDEFFEISADSEDYTYAVSWIDCVASGDSMGRGVFMRGEHAPTGSEPEEGVLERLAEVGKKVVDGRPFESNHLLNGATVRMFNEAFYRKESPGLTRSIIDYEPFFFPLDSVEHWNYIYGDRGFLQWQCVVPEREQIREILEVITGSSMASFLAVIKEFGDRDHGGLSFPQPGVTLALDFPNYGEPLFEMLDRLDDLVVEAGGRIYLGKDARLGKQDFRKMYPEWQEWKAVRDEWDPDGVFQSDLGRRLGLV